MLKQLKIARLAGFNPGYQAICFGNKNPLEDHARKIERAFHQLAKELQSVAL
jgi:hypothetical protein